ncbi:MAG: MarR family transcriptional regulator [Planctomycetes bacterium]|nr:MarR family transcriptional regulator [Planctomycetota bacterium]
MNPIRKNNESSTAPKVFDVRVLQALRRIIREVDLHSRYLSAQHKITIPQLVCLQVLEQKAPLTVRMLAHHACLSASTVIGILDRLESKGYVSRKRDEQDRRKVFVNLKEEARRLLDCAPPPSAGDFSRGLHLAEGR